jgi:hypothetical protein
LLTLALAGCGAVSSSSASSAGTAGVQPGAVHTAPTAGYLWSSGDQTLRAIYGVPGATQLGPSLVPAGQYTLGAASPVSSAALVVDKAGNLSALALPSGTATALSSGLSAASVIRFAPAGQAAVVFAPGGSGLLMITGLPSAPVAHALAAPAGLLDAEVGDSLSVLAASTVAGGVAIELLRNGTASTLTTLAQAGAVAFVPGDNDAVIVDNPLKTVALWRSVSSTPTHATLSAPTIHNAVAVGASRDGRWALVSNSGDTNLIRVDLSGATAPVTSACLCQPSAAEALAGNAFFRVSTAAAAGQPTWTVDATALQPRVLFIPAPLSIPAAGAQ